MPTISHTASPTAFAHPYIRLSNIMRSHAAVFSQIPGYSSSYTSSPSGDNWLCKYRISIIELHLSLQDTGKVSGPVVRLQVIEPDEEAQYLPVIDLSTTHDVLNVLLAKYRPSIGELESAAAYITVLRTAKEALGERVFWQDQ